MTNRERPTQCKDVRVGIVETEVVLEELVESLAQRVVKQFVLRVFSLLLPAQRERLHRGDH